MKAKYNHWYKCQERQMPEDSEMAIKEKETKFIENAESSMICDICRGVWFPPNWYEFPIK